ncbi:MAG: NAD(P)/FAD-dependent oxidoreductase [Gammaproteobacteria bacterium]|nr:MAG: NAD(P)/FAD-dependent oxidoreductase [Gammaproteobacteria bacterium]
MKKVDVIIIGASASGLMCAIEAAKRGRHVVVLDHANKAGKKILMSGGGRCNFTNYDVSSENYISHNPHFVKSALSRFTQWDFIAMVESYKIPYHEREHGQLFCDDSSKDILNLLLNECRNKNVNIQLNSNIIKIDKKADHHFIVKSSTGDYHCQSLVIASGGLSIPKMGATPFGYKVAEQFAIKVWPTSAGLVPFTLHNNDKKILSDLSGIAINSIVNSKDMSFRENILFTHRGLSGPAILQISSYWTAGEEIIINLLPDLNLLEKLTLTSENQPQIKLKTLLHKLLPKRLVNAFIDEVILDKTLQEISYEQFQDVTSQLQNWSIKPNGTEGYRTAEVTLGGVDCDALSSKTFEAKSVSGLYFIGEVMDISGWLGGYNFQWSWSSGWCAGQYV